ncbi:unnamed protein product [Orchesella dallaii]|uniref:Homeobox domain-containing protein n=1 Tax=Orchesella dallaii TaxID=48710 RepID=A0ABP1QUN0_9HEXA
MRIDECLNLCLQDGLSRKSLKSYFSSSPNTKSNVDESVQTSVINCKRSLKKSFNMSSGRSNFFHHFIPKTVPCIVLPSSMESSVLSSDNDHILNLSASLNRHCPIPKSPSSTVEKCDSMMSRKDVTTINGRGKMSRSPSPSPSLGSDSEDHANKNRKARVDMNCNDVKAYADDECSSSSSDIDRFKEDPMTDIDVDVGDHCTNDESSATEYGFQSKNSENLELKKSKTLTFGIDRILSSNKDESKDQRSSPKASREARTACESPPVVPNLSTKSECSAESPRILNDSHHSIMTKLKLCTTENQKRSAAAVPYFHHPYSSYHHPQHHPHNINSIITSQTGSPSSNENRHHHSHHHHHPLSHCSECLFLRRYCGGSSGARAHTSSSSVSSSSAANNVATNNMQFSSSMATPCGPTSSPISASFTWMANASIYDNAAIISPVTAYNPHMPLQPSFGIGATSFSTLATMQQCNSGGGSGRRKRSWSRAVFSNLQRKGLEKRFQLQKYITKPDRRQLAGSLGLTDAQVKVWFQNRRMKWRHSKEGKVSSGTGENGSVTPSSSPVTSTTSSKVDGAIKEKKA